MLIAQRIASIIKRLYAFRYRMVIYFLLVNECKNTVNPLGTFAVGNRDSYFFTHGYCALEDCGGLMLEILNHCV